MEPIHGWCCCCCCGWKDTSGVNVGSIACCCGDTCCIVGGWRLNADDGGTAEFGVVAVAVAAAAAAVGNDQGAPPGMYIISVSAGNDEGCWNGYDAKDLGDCDAKEGIDGVAVLLRRLLDPSNRKGCVRTCIVYPGTKTDWTPFNDCC